jgi:2-polyprenyl-3-methyl-5-hydroxy-6-metoxy-1,4-benzoquinol methylase
VSADLARSDYDAWHRHLPVDSEADTPWHRLVREHLVFERDVAGKQVLEIGCGRGGFACWLARQPRPPLRLVASDFSPAAIAQARAFAHQTRVPPVDWEVGDIQQIAHPEDTFDTVISCETIEHVPEPPVAVRELARVLRRGGRLVLTTPNYFGTMGLYRMYLRLLGRTYTEEGQPINQVTMLPRTIAWIRRAGLRITAVDGLGHYLPIPGRSPVRIEAMDRARPLTRWVGLHSLVAAIKR